MPTFRPTVCALAILSFAVPGALTTARAQVGTNGKDWPHNSGDAGSTKYTPATQIGLANYKELQVDWVWLSPDNGTNKGAGQTKGYFEDTPLAIDGRLYVITSFNRAACLDGKNGSTIWSYDPAAYSAGAAPNRGFLHRGMAYWKSGNSERVVYGTADDKLISLDAKTGLPDPAFGVAGKVDLKTGVPRYSATASTKELQSGVTSPVIIYQDIVIIANGIHDSLTASSTLNQPPGIIRGYNIHTGALVWDFHAVPTNAGDEGAGTWVNNTWQPAGHTNAWAPMSLDPELGYVYIPTGCPTSNHWGGHRPGDNLFSSSILCLNALTGQKVWHFQCVHHDIWDYDLGSAPNLMDIVVDGQPIKAVAQISKQGFTYVFNRETGAPVWPINELPVPQSTIPGEFTSATQPFPTKPPPFAMQGVSIDNITTESATLHQAGIDYINNYVWGPLFTPPTPVANGKNGTLQLPPPGGGGSWGGAAADPVTGKLYINSYGNRLHRTFITASTGPFAFLSGGSATYLDPDLDASAPGFQRLFKDPINQITCIDMNRGEIDWVVPNDGATGTVGWSSSLLTPELLIYVTRNNPSSAPAGTRNKLRIFNKFTGELLRNIDLPAGAIATGSPMSYIASNGIQYILVACGDTGGGATTAGATHSIVSLRLSALGLNSAKDWNGYKPAN